MKTLINNQNSESKNQVFNAIVEAIKGDKMIGRHIAESYGLNGPRPVYGIEVWESIVYVHTDTDRRIFDKAIDRLLKAHTDLFKWADFQKEAEDGPHIVLALTDQAVEWKKIVETPESVREYISKIKAEAMARVPYKKGDRIKDNQGQEGVVLDVSPNIWWNNYGVPYIMSQWGMVTNPKHFNPNDPNDQPDVDARVQLDNGKIWAGGYHLYHPVATLETASEITDTENKAVMENVSDMSNDELLVMVANELENGGKQDEPGARFKIGDRVRMKHDGATGTIARVWDGYDGFSYEVTRDVPIEGLEPGSEVWEAFPQESGLEPLEPASEITDGEAVGVLHYGTMVRMPGVVGGLKVAEIDREGDRVICKSDGEQHEYKSIAYFEQTAQEIIIPRWLRIMKYFYIGPKDKEENRVLCTAIEPNNDPEHPVVIHYNVDGEDEDSKIVLTSGLDYYNRENPTDPDGSGKPTLESVGEIKDEPFFSPGTRYRCIKAVKGCFTVGNIYDQSSEATRWHGYLRNDKGEMHCWPQIDEIAHSSELFNMKPEDADPRLFFEPVAA